MNVVTLLDEHCQQICESGYNLAAYYDGQCSGADLFIKGTDFEEIISHITSHTNNLDKGLRADISILDKMISVKMTTHHTRNIKPKLRTIKPQILSNIRSKNTDVLSILKMFEDIDYVLVYSVLRLQDHKELPNGVMGSAYMCLYDIQMLINKHRQNTENHNKPLFKMRGGDELYSPSLRLDDPAILFYKRYDNLKPTINMSQKRQHIREINHTRAMCFLAPKSDNIS